MTPNELVKFFASWESWDSSCGSDRDCIDAFKSGGSNTTRQLYPPMRIRLGEVYDKPTRPGLKTISKFCSYSSKPGEMSTDLDLLVRVLVSPEVVQHNSKQPLPALSESSETPRI
ncbi:hypothetical protein M3J09_013659 [Ascochyta lentis]